MAIADTIQSMYDNVGEVYDTITNVDVNNGNNLLKYPYLNTTSTISGVTFTDNGNGSITINGTSTSSTYSLWFLYENAWSYAGLSFELEPGTYTFKALGTDKVSMPVNIYFSDNTHEFFAIYNDDVTKTITEKVRLNMRLLVNGGVSVNNVTIYPQINKGNTALPYQPYTDNPTYKNIENIPKVIRKSYLDIMNNGIDKIWNNWEKVTREGETLTLNSTEEAPMKINLKGNTSQESTTGKNKIETTLSGSYANLTVSQNNDKTINISGTPNRNWFNITPIISKTLTNGDYVFSINKTLLFNIGLAFFDSDNTQTKNFYINAGNTSATGTIDSSDVKYRIYVDGMSQSTNYNISSLGCQLESGSSSTSYEPYTNGVSPNPDYPQDIHVVSGDNSIKVEGKNLIPLSDIISTGGTTSNGITFTLQEDGTIKANGTATGGISIYLTTNYIEQKAGTYTFSDGIVSGQSSTTYFLYADVRHLDETPWDTKYFSTFETTTRTRTIEEAFKFKPRIVVRQGQTLNNVVFKPMLENGSTATTYEAYKGASYPITLPEGMFLGWIPNTDYRDIIFQAKTGDTYYDSLNSTTKESLTYGKWYVNKQIGKVVLNGSERGWGRSGSSSNDVFVGALNLNQYGIGIYSKQSTASSWLVNRFSYGTLGALNKFNVYNPDATYGYNNIAFGISTDIVNDIDTFKTWVSSNNIVFHYLLATPTYAEITDTTLLSQLEALNGARSYENQTNINQDNNDLPFILDVTALKELTQ